MKDNCTDCSRHTTCDKIVMPEVHHYKGKEHPTKSIKVFILGESPGEEENRSGRPFVGKTGTIILRPLMLNAIEEYILDNTVRCFSGKKPNSKQIKACSRHWRAEVNRHRPDVIVALGGYAAEAVLGRKVAITEQVGTAVMLTVGKYKYPVLLNFHPAYILRQRGKKGGEYERIINSWLKVWKAIPDVLENGIEEPPSTMMLTKTKEIQAFLKMLKNDYSLERMEKTKEVMTYDYEAWGDVDALRPDLCNDYRVLSIGVGIGEEGKEQGVAFPFDTLDKWADPRISEPWKQIIQVPGRVAQYAKFEHKVNLKRFGVTEFLYDTMLAMNTIHELSRADLGSIANYCKIPWASYKLMMKNIQEDPTSVPLDKLLRYSSLDGLATHISWHYLIKRIKEHELDRILFMQQHFSLALAKTEMSGMHINQAEVAGVKRQLMRELKRVERKLWSLKEVRKTETWAVENIKTFKKGDHFNPKSPPQMQQLCVKQLKLPIKPAKYKWKDGERVDGTISLAKGVLEEFEDNYPVVKHLNKVRSIESMFSGFLNKWQKYVGPDGCVHTSYTQTIVVTGRLSSTEPNLQNMPTESVVRKVFDSRYDDGYIIAPDYSQLEPRIMAGWSGDEQMCKALNENLDLHRFVGAMIYSVDYDDVTERQRWIAKKRNLGSMYGQTPEGLADICNISFSEAKEIVAIYDAKFPGVYRFRVERHKEATRYGFVKDLFGAIRHLPDAQRKADKRGRERALRQASNFPIQSTGNRFHLIALCAMFKLFRIHRLKAAIMGPEHDKIYVDSSSSSLEEVIYWTLDAMLSHNRATYWRDKPVPMKVDVKVGRNLYEMHKWEQP